MHGGLTVVGVGEDLIVVDVRDASAIRDLGIDVALGDFGRVDWRASLTFCVSQGRAAQDTGGGRQGRGEKPHLLHRKRPWRQRGSCRRRPGRPRPAGSRQVRTAGRARPAAKRRPTGRRRGPRRLSQHAHTRNRQSARGSDARERKEWKGDGLVLMISCSLCGMLARLRSRHVLPIEAQPSWNARAA
jgi:hypothetical protein